MNALDPYVAEYYRQIKYDHPNWLDPAKMNTAELKKMVTASHKYLENRCGERYEFPDALISRITSFVPFFPLDNDCFLAAFTSNYLLDLQSLHADKYDMNIRFKFC